MYSCQAESICDTALVSVASEKTVRRNAYFSMRSLIGIPASDSRNFFRNEWIPASTAWTSSFLYTATDNPSLALLCILKKSRRVLSNSLDSLDSLNIVCSEISSSSSSPASYRMRNRLATISFPGVKAPTLNTKPSPEAIS